MPLAHNFFGHGPPYSPEELRKLSDMMYSLGPMPMTVSSEIPFVRELLQGVEKKINVAPERLLFHGTTPQRLRKIVQEGLHAGWFSDRPLDVSGPKYLVARAKDLPETIYKGPAWRGDYMGFPSRIKEYVPGWETEKKSWDIFLRELSSKEPELVKDIVKGNRTLSDVRELFSKKYWSGGSMGGPVWKGSEGGNISQAVSPEKLSLYNSETGKLLPLEKAYRLFLGKK